MLTISSLQFRRFVTLVLLLGCLIVFAGNRPVQADACSDCTTTYGNYSSYCYSLRDLCQNLGGTQCDSLFDTCRTNTTVWYYNCQNNSCIGGGGGGGGGGGDLPPQWRTACDRGCDDVYWDCYDNSGTNSNSFQTCMSNTDDLETCCDYERMICLGGC